MKDVQSTIHFCGGAGAVTGSNFLLESEETHFLVDCGLAQGRHTAEEENWEPFAYDPSKIQFLFVTHAHIDHIGRIPKLVRDGFRGRIISTEATKALARPLLMDCRELLAHDARKHGREELYQEADITKAMDLWEGIPYHQKIEVPGNFTVEFIDSGHILGSGMVCVHRNGKTLIFTGDLGGGNSPLLAPYELPDKPDYMLMESVYGDRVRPENDNHKKDLEEAIEDIHERGGTLLIPAFSTERTQDVLFEIRSLMMNKSVPSMPVYIDSPLAEKITDAYMHYPQYFSPEIKTKVEAGENIFSCPEFHFVGSAEESASISQVPA
jgi:metallo-beta-lactamase family protein